jgi:hypothetical protein
LALMRAKNSSCSNLASVICGFWTCCTLELTVWLDFIYFSLFFLVKQVPHHWRNYNWKILLHLHTRYEICFYFKYMWNTHVDGLWLLNLTNLCMCFVCVGVVIPKILFCCSKSLFYTSWRFCCQTLKLFTNWR